MGGAVTNNSNVRIRIKGRSGSVLRFFFISVAFMMPWVMMTSMLGYYAYLFGNEVLLEMNMAFYLPTIPVLILSGRLEKVLDAHFGNINSMAFRLNFGLVGCAILSGIFPFVPVRSFPLLMIMTALQGTMSAVAFSTAYQLVQYFRRADIIGLGIGGVGCGPLALLLQICLHVGPIPERWQWIAMLEVTALFVVIGSWIAMFEVTALFVVIGSVSSVSLFYQYWRMLHGDEDDLRGAEELGEAGAPLLSSRRVTLGGGPARSLVYGDMDSSEQEEEDVMQEATAATAHMFMTPDPFQGGPIFWKTPDPFQGGPIFLKTPEHYQVYEDGAPMLLPQSKSVDSTSFFRRSNPQDQRGASMPYAHVDDHVDSLLSRVASPPPPGGPQVDEVQGLMVITPFASAASIPFSPTPSPTHSPHNTQDLAYAAGNCPDLAQRQLAAVKESGDSSSQPGMISPRAGIGAGEQLVVPGEEELEGGAEMTLAEETRLALAGIWPVLTAFFASVTTMYLVFPFFTYVPSSGLLGAALPRVLFFSRVGSDMVGRFLPRRKAFLVRSPNVLVMLACWVMSCAVLLFVYIGAPERYHHDYISIGIVICIWSVGGFINTMANIMAPAMVDPSLCGRASALMALAFQVAHFAGLIMAAILVFVVFGDIAG
eukprot:gene16004-22142_t